MTQKPSLGRIVLVSVDPAMNNGAAEAPAVITRVWNDTVINVRVLTDSDSVPEWRTSLTHRDTFDGLDAFLDPRRWTWPPRV